jgi:DNA-binding GntR family transcriptional regulator
MPGASAGAGAGVGAIGDDGGMATLEPLRSQTLGVQAAEAIRKLIATGQLAGGDRLVEARIAEQLGISRGSVRDALWLLRGQGLVRDEPRRGSFVAELAAEDVRDIYDLRIAVELAAVRVLVQRPGAQSFARL